MIRSLRVSHIVLTTEDLAKVLMEHLKEYDDPAVMQKTFARLAKKYSACGSRNTSGDLGWMEVHTSAKELYNAAQEAEVGKLCGPIKTQFGYHIFVITEEEAMGDDTGDSGMKLPIGAGPGTL